MAKKRTTKKQSSIPKWLLAIPNIQDEALDRFFGKYSTLDNCIAALKKLLPLFKHIWYHPPKTPDNPLLVREHFYWPIRERLEQLRSRYGANWRPVPATIPELEDWIIDVKQGLKLDIRSAKWVVSNYEVSLPTLRLYVSPKLKKLTDHRKKPHAKNAMLMLDVAEVERYFHRKF
jgi:hypothetical protein